MPPPLTLENADLTIGILDAPPQLAVRREPLERVEAKLLHLLRAVRKARISGASTGVREALARHGDELAILLSRITAPGLIEQAGDVDPTARSTPGRGRGGR